MSDDFRTTLYRPLKLPDGENNGSTDVLITNGLYSFIPFAILVIFYLLYLFCYGYFAMKQQRHEQNQRQLIVENERQRLSNNTPEISLPRITIQHSRILHGERRERVSARIPSISRELRVNVPEARGPEVSGRSSAPPEVDKASLPPPYEEPPPYHSLHF